LDASINERVIIVTGSAPRRALMTTIIQKLITCDFDESQLLDSLNLIKRLDHSKSYSGSEIQIPRKYRSGFISDDDFIPCDWSAFNEVDAPIKSWAGIAKALPKSLQEYCTKVNPMVPTPRKVMHALKCNLDRAMTKFVNYNLASFALLCPTFIDKEEYTIPIPTKVLPKVVPTYTKLSTCIKKNGKKFQQCWDDHVLLFTGIENIFLVEKRLEQLCCASRVYRRCMERVASNCHTDAGRYMLHVQSKTMLESTCGLMYEPTHCQHRLTEGTRPVGESLGVTFIRLMDNLIKEDSGHPFRGDFPEGTYGYNG